MTNAEIRALHLLFIQRLRALRGDRSQREIDRLAGLAHGSVQRWELGGRAPNFENLARLSVAFDRSTDYLMGLEDEPAETEEHTETRQAS